MKEWEDSTGVLLEDLQEGDLEAIKRYFYNKRGFEDVNFGVSTDEDVIGRFGTSSGLWWVSSVDSIITREEAMSIVKCDSKLESVESIKELKISRPTVDFILKGLIDKGEYASLGAVYSVLEEWL